MFDNRTRTAGQDLETKAVLGDVAEMRAAGRNRFEKFGAIPAEPGSYSHKCFTIVGPQLR